MWLEQEVGQNSSPCDGGQPCWSHAGPWKPGSVAKISSNLPFVLSIKRSHSPAEGQARK